MGKRFAVLSTNQRKNGNKRRFLESKKVRLASLGKPDFFLSFFNSR